MRVGDPESANPTGRRLRILFVMRHAGLLRNFEWVLRALVDRGHEVHLGFERRWAKDHQEDRVLAEREILERVGSEFPGVTCEYLHGRSDRWASLAFDIRQALSYLRYLRPEYSHAEKLRRRWAKRTPQIVVGLTATRFGRTLPVRRALDRFLRHWERAVPEDHALDAYVADGAFDALVVTPLVDGPSEVDWLRSAKRVGIPAVFATTSWDNLTLKGLVFERPDRTYVWNEIQRNEAELYHDIPPASVVVAGAHTFDHWFEWQPSTTRAEFCEPIGLDPEKPFLLYVCSSGLIAEDERPIVTGWVETIRRNDALRDVGVLVRPHVEGTVWLDNPLAGVPNTAVWPPAGSNPIDAERRRAYFDSLHHSAAVVGINTTALIEAAIAGRRTFTFLSRDARGGQEGTLHFHYLAKDKGGALTVGRSLDEHAGQIAEALTSTDEDDPWRARFLESFVRPRGLTEAAAPFVASDLEAFVDEFVPATVAEPRPLGRLTLATLARVLEDAPSSAERLPGSKRIRRKRRGVLKRCKHFVVVQRARARTAGRLVADAASRLR